MTEDERKRIEYDLLCAKTELRRATENRDEAWVYMDQCAERVKELEFKLMDD